MGAITTRLAARSRPERSVRSMDILNEIRSKVPGEIIGVEIEQKNGRWLYEFRAIDSKGRLFEIHVDGRSGEIEGVKEK